MLLGIGIYSYRNSECEFVRQEDFHYVKKTSKKTLKTFERKKAFHFNVTLLFFYILPQVSTLMAHQPASYTKLSEFYRIAIEIFLSFRDIGTRNWFSIK
jgi:hypothetical protein